MRIDIDRNHYATINKAKTFVSIWHHSKKRDVHLVFKIPKTCFDKLAEAMQEPQELTPRTPANLPL